ncbi:MAG: TRAM domain-containing protein [Magnetococcus sp. WYHC-3]
MHLPPATMPTIGDLLDLSIDSIAYGGQGIARVDGLVVFVAGVVPGERVRVRIEKLRRNYAEAQLLAVQASSPDRIPGCCRQPTGARTPGCVYDHMAYAAEVVCKQRQAEEFLRRLPDCNTLVCAVPFPSPKERHYRNKIVLHAARGPRDKLPRLGYYGDDNRTVMDIPSCPLARAEINTALAAFRQTDEFRRLHNTESVTFRWTPTDGVVQWRDQTPPPCQHVTETAPFGAMLVPADGFYQVNPEVAAELVRQVTAWFAAGSCAAKRDLLDLYCGAGVFAIACAKAGANRVEGIEGHGMASAAAIENARLHGVTAEIHCQHMTAAAQQAFGGRDMHNTTVIVDPPRQGLEPEVVQALATAKPPRIGYVSCDPATLARDLKILLPAGYRICAARLFDMFPRTAHFELAVWLELAQVQ